MKNISMIPTKGIDASIQSVSNFIGDMGFPKFKSTYNNFKISIQPQSTVIVVID